NVPYNSVYNQYNANGTIFPLATTNTTPAHETKIEDGLRLLYDISGNASAGTTTNHSINATAGAWFDPSTGGYDLTNQVGGNFPVTSASGYFVLTSTPGTLYQRGVVYSSPQTIDVPKGF